MSRKPRQTKSGSLQCKPSVRLGTFSQFVTSTLVETQDASLQRWTRSIWELSEWRPNHEARTLPNGSAAPGREPELEKPLEGVEVPMYVMAKL